MNSPLREIIPGSAVILHFSLSLTDGTEAISTYDDEPLSFNLGDDTFQSSLELGLYGLKKGDKQSLTLTPDQAYGWSDPALIQQMPLSDFASPPDTDQIMTFRLANEEETMGVIRAVSNDEVTVDFNHPLAGHEVIFKVDILDVGSVKLSALDE